MINALPFFQTARERYSIKLAREAGKPKPWTQDPVLSKWRFCHVHREDDKTTVWFRQHIREPLNASGDKLKMAKAALIFRWFNRIETGEVIKDLILGEWDSNEARRRLHNQAPVVTGAYIIKGPDGHSKLNGVLYCIDRALPKLEQCVPRWGETLEGAWSDLLEFYYLGRFMAYELVSDLRWTPLLNEATDINTWANPGPGCARGLGWVIAENPSVYIPGRKQDQVLMLAHMRDMLLLSKEELHWPQAWPRWEMREVEHWCCEYDKYCRGASGLKLKRRYT